MQGTDVISHPPTPSPSGTSYGIFSRKRKTLILAFHSVQSSGTGNDVKTVYCAFRQNWV